MHVDLAAREVSLKIVYYGPGLAGKTTNLEQVHLKAPPERRGKLSSVATAGERTLFFDFMPLDLGRVGDLAVRLQLYTVPGQAYYAATRRIVLKGADAVVFVADSAADRMADNEASLQELREAARRTLGRPLDEVPLVMQWNKRDLDDARPLLELNERLNPEGVPSVAAVAVRGVGVMTTLRDVSRLAIARAQRELADAGIKSSLVSPAPLDAAESPPAAPNAPEARPLVEAPGALAAQAAPLTESAREQQPAREEAKARLRRRRSCSSSSRRASRRLLRARQGVVVGAPAVAPGSAEPPALLPSSAATPAMSQPPRDLADAEPEDPEDGSSPEAAEAPETRLATGHEPALPSVLSELEDSISEAPSSQERAIASPPEGEACPWSSIAPPDPRRSGDPVLGQRVASAWVIHTKLAEGGMGAVYLARHERLDKELVVKVLKPECANRPRRVERFFREARLAAKLRHPNVVEVQDVGTNEEGLHYLLMEYVAGENLHERIQRRGRHGAREATRIVREVAQALEALHQSEVIHRDVKAENVVVTRAGEVKLIDFGLAKDLEEEGGLTLPGAMIGTPVYMAPEIGRVHDVDGRVDIYSLGLTWYYLLTGEPPFLGHSLNRVIAGRTPLPPPERISGSELPGAFRNVLAKTLAWDRAQRYATVEELLADLTRLLHGEAPMGSKADAWPLTRPRSSRKLQKVSAEKPRAPRAPQIPPTVPPERRRSRSERHPEPRRSSGRQPRRGPGATKAGLPRSSARQRALPREAPGRASSRHRPERAPRSSERRRALRSYPSELSFEEEVPLPALRPRERNVQSVPGWALALIAALLTCVLALNAWQLAQLQARTALLERVLIEGR